MKLPFIPCEHISITCQGPVLALQINRPAQKNALSLAMYQTLADALHWATGEPSVKVVCLSGSGDSFSAGNDLSDFLTAPELTENHPARQFMRAVLALPQPLVAQVGGAAVGIGTTVLLHCDLVYASKNAYFQLPFVKLGLCPEFGSSALLAGRVGSARARQMLLLGESVDAAQAAREGLVNDVFPDERLATEVASICERLAALPPGALARTKALLRAGEQQALNTVIEQELEEFAACLKGNECRAALAALMQKNEA